MEYTFVWKSTTLLSGVIDPLGSHESESGVAQSCLTLRDLMDCSLPGSAISGIFQARVLEWVAIAFSAAKYYPSPNAKSSALRSWK